MGSLKERYLLQQESRHLNLARALNISWGELANLDFEVTANMSKDGLVYGYVITFDEDNDSELLNKVNGLDSNLSVQLDSWVFDRTYAEEYELDAIEENTNYTESFLKEIRTVEQLFELEVENEVLKTALLRQLFISVIGAIETYLSDAFINKALSHDHYLEKFVTNHPDFKKEKIQVSEIYTTSRNLKEKAKTIMLGTIYHKLPIVKEMYEATFNIQFPDISTMQKYIIQRHDLVHRNGKTKEGKVIVVTGTLLELLISDSVNFIKSVSTALEGNYGDEDIPF